MGLYNLQNICKILTPLFTLASSIDIHNLKSSFNPKHLWNHRVSLSMGRKKKKRKSEASWVISFLILENSQDFLFSYVSSKERREIIREHKIRNIFAIFSSITYIYIFVFHPTEKNISSQTFRSPPFFAVSCSLLRLQETLLFAWHGVSKEPHPRQACPRILLPPFLRSNQAAWNRVIARTSAQLCFSSPCKSLLPPWDLRTRDRS